MFSSIHIHRYTYTKYGGNRPPIRWGGYLDVMMMLCLTNNTVRGGSFFKGPLLLWYGVTRATDAPPCFSLRFLSFWYDVLTVLIL